MKQTETPVRILAVDDNPMNIELLQAILEPQGFAVDRAYSGKEAIDKLDESPPDLILLDVMMPGLNGYETCRKMRDNERLPYIPIIFITASELEQKDVVGGLDAGGNDYIRKPFDSAELISRIQANLRVKSGYDALAQSKAKLSQYVSPSTRKAVDAVGRNGDGRAARQHRTKNLTVLFSDIRGFTRLSTDEKPETVFEMLNRSIEKQIAIINQFGGSIDKLNGDEVMAVFEGPDMADAAVACALTIVDRLKKKQDLHQDPWATVGIGINTGPVFVGDLGTDLFRDHTVVGHTVNVAARLCGFAFKFQVLCTHATLTAIRGRGFDHRFLGEKTLKGLKRPLKIYALTG